MLSRATVAACARFLTRPVSVMVLAAIGLYAGGLRIIDHREHVLLRTVQTIVPDSDRLADADLRTKLMRNANVILLLNRIISDAKPDTDWHQALFGRPAPPASSRIPGFVALVDRLSAIESESDRWAELDLLFVSDRALRDPLFREVFGKVAKLPLDLSRDLLAADAKLLLEIVAEFRKNRSLRTDLTAFLDQIKRDNQRYLLFDKEPILAESRELANLQFQFERYRYLMATRIRNLKSLTQRCVAIGKSFDNCLTQ